MICDIETFEVSEGIFRVSLAQGTPIIGCTYEIVNRNCEIPFDSQMGFVREPLTSYEVKGELLEIRDEGFISEKSNNGGCYAFATIKVTEIIQ